MTRAALAAAAGLALILLLAPSAGGRTIRAAREPDGVPDLQAMIDAATDGDTIRLAPGMYKARPEPFTDPLCGNCLAHRTEVEASAGFRIKGKRLALIGAGPEETVLVTLAGYGVYLDDADGSAILDLAITGGRRDADGNATDAAVVVRGGRARIENVHLRDNTDRAKDVIVGIGGVMGREGAELEVYHCRITNNGWDGIALYRGAAATIADNVIEGGRGAGIGITWDAAATVLRNRVSGCWKGIGAFGQSRAVARNNAVFDNLGWGIIATGESFLEATNNVIVRNGNCGFAVWSEEATGLAANNLIVDNGWRREWVCPRVGFWHAGTLERFPARFNDAKGNARGDWLSEKGEERPVSLVSLDPGFRAPDEFRVRPGSPAVDAGDTTRTDPDGSRSDIGLTGGLGARDAIGVPPPRLAPERLRVGSRAWMRAHR